MTHDAYPRSQDPDEAPHSRGHVGAGHVAIAAASAIAVVFVFSPGARQTVEEMINPPHTVTTKLNAEQTSHASQLATESAQGTLEYIEACLSTHRSAMNGELPLLIDGVTDMSNGPSHIGVIDHADNRPTSDMYISADAVTSDHNLTVTEGVAIQSGGLPSASKISVMFSNPNLSAPTKITAKSAATFLGDPATRLTGFESGDGYLTYKVSIAADGTTTLDRASGTDTTIDEFPYRLGFDDIKSNPSEMPDIIAQELGRLS